METNDKKTELKKITDRFVSQLHDLYGVYFDFARGLALYHEKLKALQQQKVPRIIVAKGAPDNPDTIIRHSASIQEMIDRTAQQEGASAVKIGQFIIVTIAGNWEEDIRPKIASVLGFSGKDEVKSDIMRDINQIRHGILKNKGRAGDGNAATNKIIKFKENDNLIITEEILDLIFEEIFKYLNNLFFEQTGSIAYEDGSLDQKLKAWQKSTPQHVIR